MQPTKYQKIFTENVTTILKQRDRNLSWLAERADLDIATISRIVRHQVFPSFAAMEAISDGLGTSMGWLLTSHAPDAIAPNEKELKYDPAEETNQRLDVLERKVDLLTSLTTSINNRVSKK